jgi:hypothetical protein
MEDTQSFTAPDEHADDTHVSDAMTIELAEQANQAALDHAAAQAAREVATTTGTEFIPTAEHAALLYQSLIEPFPSGVHITTNRFGNIMSGVRVTLSDDSEHVSDDKGQVVVPFGLTVKQ